MLKKCLLQRRKKKPLATFQKKFTLHNVFQQKFNSFLVNLLAQCALEQELERTKEKLRDVFLFVNLAK